MFHTWYQRLTPHLFPAHPDKESDSKRLHHMLVHHHEAVSD
jgi:hypothetical protein